MHGPGPRLFRGGFALLGFLLVVGLAVWGAPTARAADDAKLVLVLDSSGSMKERVGGDTKISVAKSALRVVVGKLPAAAQVGLRVYGATVFSRTQRGACTDSQLVVPIGTNNRDALRTEIAKYKPYGETPISYSLRQAAKDLGSTGQRTILLVSDGEETCKADPCATAAAIAKQGINLKIDVIGLRVNAKARAQLRCVADRGNGTYYDAENKQQIEDSLDKLSTRAFRPFRLTGAPVEGATSAKNAPEVAPGQYVDNIPGSQSKLYYRLPRSAAGSTLRAGFTTRLPPGHTEIGAVTLKVKASSGAECSSAYAGAVSGGGNAPLVSGEVSSWRPEADNPCNTDSALVLEVTPLNDLAGDKFELVIVEEPPVLNLRHLPPAAQSVAWQLMKPAAKPARPPVSGTSLSDAATLPPGSYRSQILTGETQVFAVNADWGQRVQVEVDVAPRKGALARALDVSSSLKVQLLGAMRGLYHDVGVTGQPTFSNSMLDDADTYRAGGSTAEISYLNRSTPDGRTPGSLAGPQYVVLNMTEPTKGKRFLVPYTLVVKVVGTAGNGRPEYVRPTTASPTPSTTSPTPEPSSTPTPAPQSGAAAGVPLPAVIGIAAGAAVLGVGGAVAVTKLRRRRRPTP